MSQREVWYIDQYVGHPKYGNVYRNFYISKGLQEKGLKMKIFSASYSHLMYEYPKTQGIITKEIIDSVEFNWVQVRNYGSGRSFGRIFSIFEFSIKLLLLRNLSAPDVIITPSLSMIPIWPIWFLKKFFWKNKPKLVFEVRDIWPLTLTTLGGKNRNNLFIRLLAKTERFAYSKSDYIISSLRMCDIHVSRVIPNNFKFKWIDNGINVPNSDVAIPREIADQIPTDKFIIGYTGSLGLANAMDHFIESVKSLQSYNDLFFVIIGGGSEKKNLQRQAKGLKNIVFIEKINKVYIPKILRLFNVLYFSYANVPELYQFGVSANKTYEYMLAAKPIILSVVEMDYNIINEADCGLVIPPENSFEICNAILKMYSMDEAQRNALGENGRHYILQNNTFDILADKVYDVVDELTN